MKFYIRQSESGDIRGPFSREEIERQLPREIDRKNYLALADRGVRPENVGHQSGWVPLIALFPKIDIAPSKPSRYATERMWIDGLSRCVILVTLGTALYQLYTAMALPLVPFWPVAWSALGTASVGCLGALGVRYLIRILADIAEAQSERKDG
ncbi:hypothetical protein KBB96_00730 [Luteolibacter ambystomatis]|uniref:Uncharacterized protein n=1 Tax=Luteolibacter ambystomatis TaxID=2824561 RepID=A0A975IZL7_9BACT|nr:hypothetical protein [Luteolibacter ambystomatis]QUE51437.1 hypothetical protein KBB96_00730 [Luteolibacter ambystomatis]